MPVPQHENYNVKDMPALHHRNYNVNPGHEIRNKKLSATIGPKSQKIHSKPRITNA